MRPIKFRAWDKEEKKMGEVVGIITFPEESHIKTANDNWGQVRLEFEQRWLIVPAEADLMQFTGLHDTYEGDIAKVLITNLENEGEFLCKVVWDIKRTKFKLVELPPFKYGEDCGEIYCFEEIARIKVIGDIHTSPDLLEAKQ